MSFTLNNAESDALLQAIPAGIICLNLKEQLVLFNDKAQDLLGLANEETYLGKPFFDEWNFIRPDLTSVPDVELPHKIVLSTGEALQDAIVGLQHKNEEQIVWVNFSVTPSNNNQDVEKSRLVIVIKDISKRVTEVRNLKEKDYTFKKLVESLQSGLMILQNKKIVYVNRIMLETGGYDAQDVIGNKFLDYVHPSERNRIRKLYLKRLLGYTKNDRYKSKALKKDGGYVNVCVSVSLINFQGKPSQMVLMHDIDPIVKTQKKLEESETKYRTIVDSIGQGIIAADMNGKIRYVNKVFSELSGIQREDVVSKSVMHVLRKFADGSLLKQLIQMCQPLFEGKNLSPGTIKWRDKYFEISGKYEPTLEKIFVFIHDITELKKNSIQLSNLTRRLSDVVKSADIGTWEMNLQDRTLILNEKSAGLIGYTREELGDNSMQIWKDHIFPEDIEIAGKAMDLHFKGKAENYAAEFRMKSKTGDTVWVHSTGKISSYSKDGKPFIISGIHQDISRRKESEEAIKESERQLSTLMDNLPGMVYRCLNDKDWTMLFLSKGCEELTEYHPEGLMRNKEQSFGRLIHPEDRQVVNEIVKRSLEKKQPFEAEYRIRTRQGNLKHVWERGAGVYKNDKLLYIEGFISDVTERQKNKEELEYSEKRFNEVAEQSQTVIWEVDKEGLFTFVSPLSVSFWGYAPDELVGKKHFYDLNTIGSREAFRKATMAVFDRREEFNNLQNEIVTKNGEAIWVTTNGAPVYNPVGIFIGYRGSDKDITDLVNFENNLKLSEQKYRSIFENIQDTYYEASVEGIIMEISPSIEQLSKGQYKREELIGKSLLEMYADPRQREQLYQLFAEKGRVTDYEIVLKNKDGSFIPVAITARMLKNKDGRADKVIGVIRDISERKHSEKALKKSEERYRTIINGMVDTAWVIDDNAGILDVNNSAVEALGYSRKELLSMNIADIDHNMGKEQIKGLAKNMQKDKVQNFESWHTRKDGKKIPVEIYSSLIRYGDEQVILSIARDITVRRKAEKALIKSEAKLKFAQEIANMGSWEYDVVNNELKWSEHHFKLFGLKPEGSNMSFERFLDMVHPEDRKLFVNSIEEQTGKNSFDYRIVLKDNTVKWMQNDSVLEYRDDKLVKLFGTTFDISFKKETEKKLADSERFYKTLFENSGTAMTVIDAKGKILLANSKAIEITGIDCKSLVNSYVNEFMEKEQADKLIGDLAEFIKTGGSRIHEQTFNLQSGKQTFLVVDTVLNDENGKGYALLSSSIDITDNKAYREEIRLLSAAMAQSPNGILICNTSSEIEYANEAFTKNMGYSLEEIKGKTPEFLLALKGKGREALLNELYATIYQGNTWKGEVLDVAKDGRQVWINNAVSPVYDENGKATHVVFARENITEKKKMWEELVVAKEKAEESNKLKSTFLATMSHELRTPLNHVIGFSDLIQDISDDEEIVEFARTINSSGNGLLEIIEDIFNLALYEQSDLRLRVESYKLMNIYIELKDQLKEILNASGKESQIELIFNPEPGILGSYIHCDKNKIKQVIVNLFKNAVKFTEEGCVEFGFYMTDDCNLALYVKDTGAGIPADKINMIFDFFRQADETHSRKFGGVGIGLAISRKIADAMKGSILVKSEYGEGAEFTFTIPVNLEMPEDGKDNAARKPELDLNGHNILIVEDDPGSMQLVSRLVTTTEATIYAAENGREAVKLTESENDLDLILMDLKMPVMDGYEATQTIRSNNKDVKIIALTSYAMEANKQQALDAGCNMVLTKPVNKAQLFKSLRKYLLNGS